ncbi:MAG: class I SAM-dependent methyltransferase [Bacillota bacterium]
MDDSWSSGNAYEIFMGRWSTLAAEKFLKWLDIPPACSWLDVGCGTGTLTKLILKSYYPSKVISIDSSDDFIKHAKNQILSPLVDFKVMQAQALDLNSGSIDVVVSGLVLNFVPEPLTAVSEMKRVTKPNGVVGIFLWDYSEGMQMLRYFWDAAAELTPEAHSLDEGERFILCKKGNLESLAADAGLKQVETMPIEVETVFRNFDDYWQPFLGNVGPAPAFVMSLNKENRQLLENKLRKSLPTRNDGSISLNARAWAVKAKV